MSLSEIEKEKPPRKTMALFFIVDTSGSMAGSRIGAVNSAVEQTLEKLREMNADNLDAEIEVAFLEFSTGAKWLTDKGPMKVDNYYWNDMSASGMTDLGIAFKMLEEKLHKTSGFMQRASGSLAPVMFLMSDGEPTDDYKTQLTKLKANKWFQVSTKVALAIGDQANDTVLKEFTGYDEAVVRIPDGENAGEKLAKMVKFLAITSSQVNSTLSGSTDMDKQHQMNDAIQKALDDDEFDTD